MPRRRRRKASPANGTVMVRAQREAADDRGGPAPDPFRRPDLFRRFAAGASQAMGSPWAFAAAAAFVLAWALTGPLFGYSEIWQLVVNTATTIVTFLMVFLIQNTQNRDTKAIHLKLDELIRGVHGARTRLVDLEHLSDEDLDALQGEFERLRKRAGRGGDAPSSVKNG